MRIPPSTYRPLDPATGSEGVVAEHPVLQPKAFAPSPLAVLRPAPALQPRVPFPFAHPQFSSAPAVVLRLVAAGRSSLSTCFADTAKDHRFTFRKNLRGRGDFCAGTQPSAGLLEQSDHGIVQPRFVKVPVEHSDQPAPNAIVDKMEAIMATAHAQGRKATIA